MKFLKKYESTELTPLLTARNVMCAGFPIVFQRGGGDKISQKVHRFWQKVSSHDFHHGLGRKCKKYGNLPKFNRKEVFLFDFLPEKRQKKLKNRISVSF